MHAVEKLPCMCLVSRLLYIHAMLTLHLPVVLPPENTPDIVVNSLLEGGTALRPVTHRHLLRLVAYNYLEGEQPMLLYPKSALGTLKSLLLNTRETRTCVSGGGLGHLWSQDRCPD